MYALQDNATNILIMVSFELHLIDHPLVIVVGKR